MRKLSQQAGISCRHSVQPVLPTLGPSRPPRSFTPATHPPSTVLWLQGHWICLIMETSCQMAWSLKHLSEPADIIWLSFVVCEAPVACCSLSIHCTNQQCVVVPETP